MATAHKSRVLDMTQGDPFRLVLQFSMPLFCSNLLQQLYNLTGHCAGRAPAGFRRAGGDRRDGGAVRAYHELRLRHEQRPGADGQPLFWRGRWRWICRAVGWMVTLSAAVSLVLTGCSCWAATRC